SLAQRVLISKICVGQDAVNYCDTRGRAVVFRGEEAAPKQRYPHRAEIIRTRVEHQHLRRRLNHCWLLGPNPKGGVVLPVTQRKVVCKVRRLHPGNTPDTLKHLLVGSSHAGG